MSATALLLPVTDGGNKFELFAQLSDIGRVAPHRTLFRLRVNHPTIRGSAAQWANIGVMVNGIVAEDGSGESWMISGYVLDRDLKRRSWLQNEFANHGNNFHGLYNTRSRTGFIFAGAKTR